MDTDDPQLPQGALRLHLRTPTLPPATATNTLILGGSRLVVIEPATPHAGDRARLDDALAALAAEGRSVEAILLTHHHADHIGYAEPLAQRLGVPIIAHADTMDRVAFAVDETWEDGQRLDLGEGFVVEAVHTPGHAPGHLVYYEHKTRLAYAGDMVAGQGTILIDPEDGGDMSQYLDSLRRLGALGAHALVPSHGDVLDDPLGVTEHYIAHRLAREAKVVDALADGPLPMDDLLARVYADTPTMLWPLARRVLRAHLNKLEAEASVVCKDGVVRNTLSPV